MPLTHVSRMARLGLTMAFFIFLANQAQASINITVSMYDPSPPIVTIKYTSTTNPLTLTTENVYAGAQKAPVLGSTPVYCIDLTHDNYVPTSYTVNSTSTPGNPAISTSTLNQIAWAVEHANSVFAGTTSADKDGRSASQLLVWKLLDTNFTVTNWQGHNSLQTAYTNLMTTMTSLYNPSLNYLGGVQFYNAVHSGKLYQDLVIGLPGTFHPTFVGAPEPSSLAIAGLGGLGLAGYGWRKRKRSLSNS